MLSWSYDAVRHVQTATALLLDSFRRRDDVTRYRSIELLSLQHAKMAVAALLTQSVPVEVEIVVSTILWMFDILIGRGLVATNHLVSAYRLASRTDPKCTAEPLVAKYISSFVGELNHTLNPMAIADLPKPEQRDLLEGRILYSKDIFLDAKHSIQTLKKTLIEELDLTLHVHGYTRAKALLESSEKALDNVLGGWHHPARFDCSHPGKSLSRDIRYAEAMVKYSPFRPILRYFETFFEDHNEEWLTRFHLQFRPCVDYFMWIAAGSDLKARQAVMPLWNVQWAISPRASAIADK